MTRALRKAGRSLLVFVIALIPCVLLILSLAAISRPPLQAARATPPFTLTFQDQVSVPASPPAPETAAADLSAPAPPVPVFPSRPLLPTERSNPSKPVPTTENLPVLKPDSLPSRIKVAAVSRPEPAPQPIAAKPPSPLQAEPSPPENIPPTVQQPAATKKAFSSAHRPPSPLPTPRSSPRITGYEWGEIDHPPTVVRRFPPKYPYRARRKGIIGTVVIRFLISTDGTVSSTKIMRSEPKGVFENAALSCIKKWRFRPGRHQGKPVPTWAELPFRFKL